MRKIIILFIVLMAVISIPVLSIAAPINVQVGITCANSPLLDPVSRTQAIGPINPAMTPGDETWTTISPVTVQFKYLGNGKHQHTVLIGGGWSPEMAQNMGNTGGPAVHIQSEWWGDDGSGNCTVPRNGMDLPVTLDGQTCNEIGYINLIISAARADYQFPENQAVSFTFTIEVIN